MSTEPPEQAPEPQPKKQPPSNRDAMQYARRVRNDPDSPRGRQAGAALGGICIVFIVALMSGTRLDMSLHVALLAFVVAIPFLLEELIWGSLNLPMRFHGSRFPAFFARSMSYAAFWMSAIGYFAAGVGFIAVVWHLWPFAAVVLVVLSILVPFATMAVAFVSLIFRLMSRPQFKKQQRERAQQRALGKAPPSS